MMEEGYINKFYKELINHDLKAIIVNEEKHIKYTIGETRNVSLLIITLDSICVFQSKSDLYRSNDKRIKNSNIYYIEYQNGTLFDEMNKVLKHYSIDVVGFESKHLSYFEWKRYRSYISSKIILEPVTNFFENIRLIKSNNEIDKIKKAGQITEQVLDDFISTTILCGETEIELEKMLETHILRNGIDKLPFRFEISSGYKSSLVNTLPSNKIIQKGDLLLIDLGIEYDGYVTDIARTYSVGNPSEKQNILYNSVKSFMEALSSQLVPGREISDIVNFSKEYYKKIGLKHDLPHDIGHGIGIDFHEAPYLSSKYHGELKKGMVISLEPGIYLNSGGVRLEDMILLTDFGPEFITNCKKNIPIINYEGR